VQIHCLFLEKLSFWKKF